MKLFCLILVFTYPILSQETIFDKLKGRWMASGTSFGNPAEIEMSWQKTLQDKFFQIHYKIASRVKNEDRVFYGTAYYRTDSAHHHSATWFDSGGEMHPITASDDGKALVSIWGVPGKKLGKTIYTILDDNSVEIVDYIQKKDQTWKEFSRNVLRRSIDD